MARGTHVRRGFLAVLASGALLLAAAGPAEAGSLKRVNYRSAADDPAKTNFKFFDRGGLTMEGNCAGGSLTVEVGTKVDGAMIHADSQFDGGDGAAYREDDDWDSNEDFDLFSTFPEDDDSGHIVYARSGGKVVTVDWLSETSADDDPYGGDKNKDCVFVGTARVLDSSFADRINYRADADDPPKTFKRGGLSLTASCEGGQLLVEADTNTENSMLFHNIQFPHDEGQTFEDAFGSFESDFDPGSPITVFGATQADHNTGAAVYGRPGGINVTAVWAGEDQDNGDEAFGKDCVFVGTMRRRVTGDAKRVNFRFSGDTTAPVTFFNQGGLKLRATCDPDSPFDPLDVLPEVSGDHRLLHANTNSLAEGIDYGEDDDILVSENGTRGLFGAPPALLHHGSAEESGQLLFSTPGGTYTTINWAAHGEEGFEPFGGTKDCAFVGTAEISKP